MLCFGLYLRWLVSPLMLRFMGATLLFRIILSEQTTGAVGLMNTLRFTNDQMHPLFLWVTAGTVGGFLLALLALPSKRFGVLGDIALVLIIIAAWMDSQSTVLTRPTTCTCRRRYWPRPARCFWRRHCCKASAT